MKRTKILGATLFCASLVAMSPAARAAGEKPAEVPDWAKPMKHYLVDQGWISKDAFHADEGMSRTRFTELMDKAFGPGFYSRDGGKVTAKEVDAALVEALGQMSVAKHLNRVSSPDGWSPKIANSFGTEIVARNLGLRHDRATSEEAFEASAEDAMSQADVAYAIWKAKTAPSTWSADQLKEFSLPDYDATTKEIVQYAFSLVGTPYVWGGEWASATPAGYPYGAQVHGGVDCSGFTWMVLAAKTSSWNPPGRPYDGWSFPERSSSDMARATNRRTRIRFKDLKPADVLLFASNGKDSKGAEVYHAGVYLGRGWMVHSSGSRAGVSIDFIGDGSWWRDQFWGGRRVVTK